MVQGPNVVVVVVVVVVVDVVVGAGQAVAAPVTFVPSKYQ